MPDRLFTFYQRKRVVNINVNVIAAAVLSTATVMGIVWVMQEPMSLRWPSWAYTVFAFAADVVLDVVMFILLHWVANHWRPIRGQNKREHAELMANAPNHVRDTTRVQMERAVISPLYYVVASALTYGAQEMGMHPSWAIGMGYLIALVLTRVLHTAWGLRSGTYVDHHNRAGNGSTERVPGPDDRGQG